MLVVLTLFALTPAARSAGDPLDEAEAAKAAALAEVAVLTGRIERVRARFEIAQAEASQAAAHVVDAYRAGLQSDGEVEAARDALAARARAVYQAGPAGLLEIMLSAGHPSDLAMVQRVIDDQILGDVDRIADALDEAADTVEAGDEVERLKEDLRRRAERLEPLLQELAILLGHAQDAARRAGEEVRELERQRRELSRAAREVADLGNLALGGVDQSELLEMLGPDGGRGCDIPEALSPTGKGFTGVASWYGWDFAGRPTASGAIYDPRLFTAAHKTLPLPTFLHVKHAGKCATVLVNDRGPFIEGRVLDLSQGSAEYLGVGLNEVAAEILVPTT